MTNITELFASFLAVTGFAPARKPSVDDEAKAAAAQAVLIAASKARRPVGITAT
jgi:hypothetical protein